MKALIGFCLMAMTACGSKSEIMADLGITKADKASSSAPASEPTPAAASAFVGAWNAGPGISSTGDADCAIPLSITFLAADRCTASMEGQTANCLWQLAGRELTLSFRENDPSPAKAWVDYQGSFFGFATENCTRVFTRQP